jgi:hypothetical protein
MYHYLPVALLIVIEEGNPRQRDGPRRLSFSELKNISKDIPLDHSSFMIGHLLPNGYRWGKKRTTAIKKIRTILLLPVCFLLMIFFSSLFCLRDWIMEHLKEALFFL